jgi:hypothetical protein
MTGHQRDLRLTWDDLQHGVRGGDDVARMELPSTACLALVVDEHRFALEQVPRLPAGVDEVRELQ